MTGIRRTSSADTVRLIVEAYHKFARDSGSGVNEIASVVGGKGGGKPDMAMAGGKEPEKLDAALERSYEAVAAMLG